MLRTFITVGVVLALLISGGVFLVFFSPTSVSVRNDSGQTLTAVSVTVQGRRLDFPDLAAGRSARRWFPNTGADGHYSFFARRSDRTEISEDKGYITSGSLHGAAQFTITPSGYVSFTEKY